MVNLPFLIHILHNCYSSLGRYFDEISQDTGKFCFGVDDTLKVQYILSGFSFSSGQCHVSTYEPSFYSYIIIYNIAFVNSEC